MNLKNKVATIAAASIFALSLAVPVLAAEPTYTQTGNVVQEIKAGNVTYSLKGATLPAVTYNESADVTSSGALFLFVSGNGNLNGWDLQIQATGEFAYSGQSANGVAIPAANLSLVTANAPTHSAGQVIDATNGPVSRTGTGSLGSAQPVLGSKAKYGSGTYEQKLDVSLTIPKASQVGTYTGVVTVSTASAPGN